VPYRVSQSHALDNLICLCQKCHLTEEAKVQDQWGGQLEAQFKRVCSCGGVATLRHAHVCFECAARTIQAGEAKSLRLGPAGLKTLKYRLKGMGLLSPSPRPPRAKPPSRIPHCGKCGAPTPHPLPSGCKACLTPWVIAQRATRSLRDIAQELGVSNPTLVHWCHFNPG
jgi:hypothetical protein